MKIRLKIIYALSSSIDFQNLFRFLDLDLDLELDLDLDLDLVHDLDIDHDHDHDVGLKLRLEQQEYILSKYQEINIQSSSYILIK